MITLGVFAVSVYAAKNDIHIGNFGVLVFITAMLDVLTLVTLIGIFGGN